jgi:hypothetical protein
MANEAIINTFVGGMDLDTDVSLLPPNRYRRAVNFRLASSGSGANMVLEMVLGTELITVPSTITGVILGYCWMRDELVLFTSTNRIYVFTFNSTFTDVTTIRLAYENLDLDFNVLYPIKAIARYESEDIQKIYWTDNLNPVRFANIAVSNTALATLTVDQLEFIPNTLKTSSTVKVTASVTATTGGFYTSGRLQYAVQLISNSGTESPIYLNPSFYNIGVGADNASTDKGYLGGTLSEPASKGFIISVTNIPTGFSKVRLIAVLYSSYNQEPAINIVAETNISNITAISIADQGSVSLGEISLEEMSILSTGLFKARELETKNDVLFAGNITDETWDVTYDARAYRYAGLDNTVPARRGNAGIWNAAGAYFEVNASFQMVVGGGDVPITHDCINKYNDRSYDISSTYENRYRYQTNTTTLGGEGPNVKYKFNITLQPISNLTVDTVNAVGNTIDGPGSVVNGYKHEGYQRGEIYRFGIVFHDDRGRDSSVNWIGDIRFPDLNDAYTGDAVYLGVTNVTPTVHQVSFTMGDIVYACVLTPNFTVSNLPSGAVGYTIVRALRDTANRTVLASGLFGGLAKYAAGSFYYPPARVADQYDMSHGHFYYDDPSGVGGYNADWDTDILYSNKLEFISPEINFNKNIVFGSSTTDYLIYSAYASQFNAAYSGSNEVYTSSIYANNFVQPDPFLTSYYYGATTAPSSSIKPNYRSITAFTIAGKSSNNTHTDPAGALSLGVDLYKNYIRSKNNTYHGTTGAMAVSSNITVLDSASQDPLYGSYIRLNPNMYIGTDYYSRFLTEYRACTGIRPVSGSFNVLGGDTYITMFEYLRAYIDLNREASIFSNVTFPVESTFNLALRSDRNYKQVRGENDAFLLQEEAGVHETVGWGTSFAYTQLTDLYLYNTVYSQQNKTKVFFQKDTTIIVPSAFDCRVLYSDIKINNETIDSWTKFRSSNYKDVDTSYGSLSALGTYKNQLLFWQTNAFGMLSVNQRELIPSSSVGVAPLVLGTGGILDRYDYISYETGNSDHLNIVKSNFGIYWFDLPRKTLCQYNGNLELLSKTKNVNNLFRDTTSNVTLSYDPIFNEILAGKTGSYGVVVYSELTGLFTGFYRFIPSKSFNSSKVLITNKAGTVDLYAHRNEGSPGIFYADTVPYSDVQITCNDKYPITKVFDNVEFETEAIDTANALINDIDRTFTSIRFYDTYQNTGQINLTYNSNLRRKDRGFTLVVPRNAVDTSVNTALDILDASNLDTTRQFKDRMRDKYLNMEFVYSGDSTAYKLRLPYIVTKYRISDR